MRSNVRPPGKSRTDPSPPSPVKQNNLGSLVFPASSLTILNTPWNTSTQEYIVESLFTAWYTKFSRVNLFFQRGVGDLIKGGSSGPLLAGLQGTSRPVCWVEKPPGARQAQTRCTHAPNHYARTIYKTMRGTTSLNLLLYNKNSS